MITHAWRIIQITGRQVLLCLLCNRYSANPNDIAECYCGYCHVWLHEVPMDFRPHPVGPLETPRLTSTQGADDVPEWQERGARRAGRKRHAR